MGQEDMEEGLGDQDQEGQEVQDILVGEVQEEDTEEGFRAMEAECQATVAEGEALAMEEDHQDTEEEDPTTMGEVQVVMVEEVQVTLLEEEAQATDMVEGQAMEGEWVDPTMVEVVLRMGSGTVAAWATGEATVAMAQEDQAMEDDPQGAMWECIRLAIVIGEAEGALQGTIGDLGLTEGIEEEIEVIGVMVEATGLGEMHGDNLGILPLLLLLLLDMTLGKMAMVVIMADHNELIELIILIKTRINLYHNITTRFCFINTTILFYHLFIY